MFFIFIISIVQGGQIIPYLRKPIEPLVNNENEVNDYLFTFTIETDLYSGDQLLIHFPSQYTFVDAAAPDTVTIKQVELQRWNPDLQLWQLLSGCSCVRPNGENIFKVTLPDVKAGSYKISIKEIQNPTYGGTGNFKLETRRNDVYQKDLNLLDYNYAFGKVGIVKAPIDFSSISISYLDSFINKVNTLTISFTTTFLIPKDGKLTLDLSSSIFIILDDQYTISTTIQGNITRSGLLFRIDGFENDQSVQNYQIIIGGVQNPSYSGIPGQLTLRTWTNNTNTILNQKKLFNFPTISAGVLTDVQVQSHCTLTGSSDVVATNDLTYYEIRFSLLNPVDSTGMIEIHWLSSGLTDTCSVTSGLYDQNEGNQLNCVKSGNYYQIYNFKRVQPKTKIILQFKAVNPSPSMSNLEINTYQDTGKLQLVDTYSQSTGINLQSYTQFGNVNIDALTVDELRAGQTATQQIHWQDSNAISTGKKFKIIYSTDFSFTGTTCTAYNDVPVADTGSCTISGKTITYTFGNAAFSTVAYNTLKISGVNNPTTPGEYPLPFYLLDSSNVVIARRTVYFNVLPYKLTSISSFRLSQDQAINTLFYFKFPAPLDLPSSEWRSDYNILTSQIWVEFQTDDTFHPAPANYQFLLDLGTGLSNQATIPCYGYQKLQPLDGNDEIKCNIIVPSNSPSPATIKAHHYRAILQNNVIELHLPNIQNPRCESYLVTVDDLCRSTASVTIKILYTQNRKSYIMYQSAPTDANLIFAAVLPKIIVKNKYNDNLVGGLPSQPSPYFVPSIINQESTIQIRYEPGSTKPLKLTDTNQGIIFVFPQLPTTNPQAYIVNKNVKCSLGLLTPLNCYAYKEVGWVVVIHTSLLEIPGTGSVDVTFYLKNFINPFYAADPIGYIEIYTIKDNQQWERAIYQDLPNFSPGSSGSVQIISRRYEANMIDVEYNWLFSLNNDIPEGGQISLIYAVNFYNHRESQNLQYKINQGIDTSSTTTENINVNIFTIKNIKPYKKNTIISIKMTGVKNPPKAGLTNYFGVSSQTAESFYIDQKTDVTPLTIIQQVAIGEIIFNYFRMYPDNGSPDGSIFPATYEISFYPTRNIPKYGFITITFPSDFTEQSLLDIYTQDNSYLRCYVGGSLKTMQDCYFYGTTSDSDPTLKIQIKLDTELRIEAGMEPVIVKILNIKNFNEDKNSGVVVIQTLYDAVVLDDSGTTETNRKATTGLKATFMTNTQYSLVYYPTTEGVQATYELTLKPSLDMKDTATIIVEFPLKFPYGLGGNIGCNIPLLAKATNDPIQCSVSGWQVTLSNLKAYTVTTDGFTIILNNIRNPNLITGVGTVTTPSYQQSIRVYIMSNSTHAQEYVENMGSLIFTQPAGILQMEQLYITSSNTRDYADYTLELKPEIGGSVSNFKLGFQQGYQISQLWSEKKLTLDGVSYDVEPTANNFNFDSTYTLDQTKIFKIIVLQLPNPLDEGICPGYPDVSLYDQTTKQIIVQTYWNLMQPTTPNFLHAGNLIIIDDDNPNHYIEAGTYTNNITLSLYPITEATETMTITPVFDETFNTILTITPMNIDIGSKTGYFRIGIDTSISVLRVVIKFTHSIAGYIPLRPIYLWIQRYKNITISVSDVSEVPAGGRSQVQQVQMLNGPFKSITFSFYILNNQPAYSAVYPKTITLSDGQTTGQFWVSCGSDTQGAIGQLMTIIAGDDKSTFQVENRVRNFSVINPEYNIPFIVNNGIVLTTDVAVQVRIVTNEPCTIYFAVTPPFIRDVTLEQIKNKTLPYDYFNYPYVFGEYVTDSPTYEYLLFIDSLQPATLYQFKAFVQDFSGNLANEPIILSFNTTGYTDPFTDSLTLTSTPTVTADTNNSLSISGLTGKLHAIALRSQSYIYVNHFSADPSVIRYRRNRILQTSTTTDTTGTGTTGGSTTGTDTTGGTTTDTTGGTTTDTTGGGTTTDTTGGTTTDTTGGTTTDTTTTNNTTTETNNTSTIDVLQSDPYVPETSDYTCKLITLNYLSQLCEPTVDRKANFTRIDYYAQQQIISPNGKQISRGENHEGILVEHYATSSSGSLSFTGLVSDSDYFIFIVQENNGQFSKTPLMVKGTTRTLFVLYQIMLFVPLIIIMII